MKNMGDKAISEKLGELDTLPHGYEPNLDSKWELLEASMSKCKDSSKRLVYTWMSIAASLLIIFSLGISLYFNQDKEITAEKNRAPLIPLATSEPPTSYLTEDKNPAENSGKIQTEIMSSHSTAHVSIAKSMIQPLLAQKNTDLLQKDSVVENPESETIKTFVSAQVLPTKKNKQRYVQVDFGDVATQAATPPEQGALSIKFRINLFQSGINEETDNNALDKSLVLLKLNLNN